MKQRRKQKDDLFKEWNCAYFMEWLLKSLEIRFSGPLNLASSTDLLRKKSWDKSMFVLQEEKMAMCVCDLRAVQQSVGDKGVHTCGCR